MTKEEADQKTIVMLHEAVDKLREQNIGLINGLETERSWRYDLQTSAENTAKKEKQLRAEIEGRLDSSAISHRAKIIEETLNLTKKSFPAGLVEKIILTYENLLNGNQAGSGK